jgi:hypothetical protein
MSWCGAVEELGHSSRIFLAQTLAGVVNGGMIEVRSLIRVEEQLDRDMMRGGGELVVMEGEGGDLRAFFDGIISLLTPV